MVRVLLKRCFNSLKDYKTFIFKKIKRKEDQKGEETALITLQLGVRMSEAKPCVFLSC